MPRKVIFVIGVNASGKTYYINRTYGKEDVDWLNIYDFQQRAYVVTWRRIKAEPESLLT